MTTRKSNRLAAIAALLNNPNYQNLEVYDDWIIYYSVARNDGTSGRYLHVTPHAVFQTLDQAKAFRENVLDVFPQCKVAREGFSLSSISELGRIVHDLFYSDFPLIIQTDQFAPIVERDAVVLIRQGIEAKDGDIVAVGTGDNLCRRLAFYDESTPYFGVVVATVNQMPYDDERNLTYIKRAA